MVLGAQKKLSLDLNVRQDIQRQKRSEWLSGNMDIDRGESLLQGLAYLGV